MLLNVLRPTGSTTYTQNFWSAWNKTLNRLELGFSPLSEHKFIHNFAE